MKKWGILTLNVFLKILIGEGMKCREDWVSLELEIVGLEDVANVEIGAASRKYYLDLIRISFHRFLSKIKASLI